MCIIIGKIGGAKFPEMKTLEQCWANNPDGAGLMWAVNGSVFVQKGFMDYKHFEQFINDMKRKHDLDKLPMVLHFRITTHGGTSAQNTHPFPITDEFHMLKKLQFKAPIAVAHNGIISMADDGKKLGLSDTQMFIKDYLSLMEFPRQLQTENGRELIEKLIESKMAFLEGTGTISLIGNFVEDNGVYYSNNTYKEYRISAYDYSQFNAIYNKGTWVDEFMAVDYNQIIELESGEVLQGNDYYFDDYGLIYQKDSGDANMAEDNYHYIGSGAVFDENFEVVPFDVKKAVVIKRFYSRNYDTPVKNNNNNYEDYGHPFED